MNENPSDRVPRRRWFRFSLRTLLLLVTVLGVWLGLHLQAMRRQQESITAIKDVGGWCYYDFQDRYVQGLEPDLTAISPVPSWLHDWLGDDFFHHITNVNLIYQENSRGFRQENRHETCDNLKYLVGFPKLKVLLLRDNQASDVALSHIAKLIRLQVLIIEEAHDISDEGVAHLSRLQQLKLIYIGNSSITDDSLQVFSTMPSLESLNLEGAQISNRGLSYLRHMAQLKCLLVEPADVGAITDDGLICLKELVNLEVLNLNLTGITNSGLQHLKELKKLKTLYLKHTAVDDVSDLQSALPNCKISK